MTHYYPQNTVYMTQPTGIWYQGLLLLTKTIKKKNVNWNKAENNKIIDEKLAFDI